MNQQDPTMPESIPERRPEPPRRDRIPSRVGPTAYDRPEHEMRAEDPSEGDVPLPRQRTEKERGSKKRKSKKTGDVVEEKNRSRAQESAAARSGGAGRPELHFYGRTPVASGGGGWRMGHQHQQQHGQPLSRLTANILQKIQSLKAAHQLIKLVPSS